MTKITYSNLIKMFMVEENYKQYFQYLNLSWITQEARQILYDLREYYEKYPGDVDLEKFIVWFNSFKHFDLHDSQLKLYSDIFNKLVITKDLPPKEIISRLQQEALKDQIRESLDSNEDLNYLVKQLQDYNELSSSNKIEGESSMDLEVFKDSCDRSKGLKWRLDCLNKALGGVLPGDLIIVAAFVDGGKTAFAISELVYMATQIKEGDLLWFNNEEVDERVKYKIYCSVLGQPIDKIRERWEYGRELYIKKMHGDINRIRFFNCRGKGVRYIENTIKKYNPKLIVIDQADKLRGGKGEDGENHIRLGKLYDEIRSRIAMIAPTICVSQCNSSVTYQDKDTKEIQYLKVIDQTQLAGTTVNKQGEADAIVTIGQDKDRPNSRYISVPKNKMGTHEDNIWRHLRGYEVQFNGEICRYENPIYTTKKD